MPPTRIEHDADAALIERTRQGESSAFAQLWQRHSASGRTVARSYSSLDPDDLVSESFTRIYDAILAGKGPTTAFRPYLFTTIRNTAASWGRARHETNLETLESFEDPDTSEAATLEALDRSTTAQAFRSLPSRWQEVLWYSEVEGMSPQQIAPLVGMSANSTAALAYRAREGLRQAWIRAHLKHATEPECRWTIDRLGTYTRGKLRARDTAKLETHLDDCARCTIVAAEAREVGSRLALVLLPLAAGIGGATAYSGWLSQGAPVADYAMGAAGVGAAAGAASGAASGTGGAAGVAGAGSAGAAGAAGGAGAGSAGGGASGTGIAIGAGAAVAAAVAAAAVMLPGLMAPDEPPAPAPSVESQTQPEAPAPVTLPGPTPVAEAPLPPRTVGPDTVPVPAPVAAPAPAAPPPLPAEPIDTSAPAPTVSSVDTAGGIAQPIVSGTAEPGATVAVAADAGSWTTVAGSSGAFSLETTGLPAGHSDLAVTQTDVAGNVSEPALVGVDLVAPTLVIDSSDTRRPIITLSGVSAATVEILFDGTVTEIVAVDGGSVELRGRVLSNIITMADPEISLRYLVDGRAGAWATATYAG
ncbi:sigma-70 family RNA polymerase sigma factor [Agromyces neolithicus]|uniref:Sigma-70 family RNA polymerase sigma factor n=1 Tax=Agromyces neolithicus TaxID=269420 RepID=A0ABN2M5M4_9MICO